MSWSNQGVGLKKKPAASERESAESKSRGAKLMPLSPEIRAMVADVKVENEQLAMPEATFAAWRKKVQALPAAKKAALAEEAIIVANRYLHSIGSQSVDAIAQFTVLAGDLMALKAPKTAAPESQKKPPAPRPEAAAATKKKK